MAASSLVLANHYFPVDFLTGKGRERQEYLCCSKKGKREGKETEGEKDRGLRRENEKGGEKGKNEKVN